MVKSQEAKSSEHYSQLINSCMRSDYAMELLVELCDDIGPRFSGSPALDEAIGWSIQAMKKIGVDRTSTQPVMVPKWVRGRESLKMLSPQEEYLPMLGLGMSIGTPENGVEGEIVVVETFPELNALPDEQIKGKIVLFDAPFTNYGATVQYRMHGPAAAEKRGAVAALVRSVTNKSLNTPHTGITDKGVGIPSAAITVEDSARIKRLTRRGKTVRVRLKMEAQFHGRVQSSNVIGDIIGSEKPDEIVLIGGHLDSWDICPGAQDDGAGCVMCLDAVREILSLPVKPKRTIRVVLFTNEENGLDGGREYAEAFGLKEKHFACAESDAGCGIPLQFNYHKPKQMNEQEYQKLLKDLIPAMETLKGIEMGDMIKGYSGADIGPLVRMGVPGFGLGMDLSTYWPIHHTRADTIEKIDPVNLKKGTAAMAVLTWALANI